MPINRIPRSNVVYHISADAPFIAAVRPGERFLVETHDCRTGTITADSHVDDLRETRWINPATGPIEVVGTVPGDILAIDIKDLRTSDRGLMITRPGTTVLDIAREPSFRITDARDGRVRIGPVSVAARPMIGVLALAPATGSFATLVGGSHGGNMDTNLLTAGTRMYLPVGVAGGGLHVGDLHAAMGDGEVFLTGVEVAGEVELTVHRITAQDRGPRSLPTPLLETSDRFVPVATGSTLDLAARAALDAALRFLTEWVGMDPLDAGFFLSAACDLRVSQFLPGVSIHCRVEIPREPLHAAGLRATILGAGT